MRTTLAVPASRLRYVGLVFPIAALAWFAYIGLSFARSAIATLDRDDFTGAAAARAEVEVILLAGAIALAASTAAWLISRRMAVPFVALMFTGGAITLSLTSGQAGALAAACLLLVWCWGVGGFVLDRLRIGPAVSGAAAHSALAIGLGMATLSFAVLALALLGLVGDVSLALLLVAGLLTLPLSVQVLRRKSRPLALPALEFGEQAALVGVASAALLGLAVCLTPQTAFDALHYHLALPRYVLEQGAFVERPDIIQSYFPLGMEMTYVPAFWLGGEATANLLHWAFLPLTAALVWSAGDRMFGRPAGAVGSMLFALMPLAVWESTSASSDLALTFFAVAAVFLTIVRLSSGRELALACGLCAGLALAFKVVAAIYILPLTIAFVASVLISKWRPALPDAARPLALFAAGGLLGGGPWLLLRYVQAGNPVMPLLNNVFKSNRWSHVNERFDLDQFGIGTSLNDFASFWWQASADPARFGQATPDWMAGVVLLAPVGLLLLAPVLGGNGRTDRHADGQSGLQGRAALVWLVAAGASILSWFFFSQYLRYGLPALALLAPLGGWAFVEALRAFRSPIATGLGSIAVVAILGAAGAVISVGALSLTPGHFPTDVLLGREREEDYRSYWIPNRTAIASFDQASRGTDESGVILGFPYNYFASNRLYDVIVPATLSPFRRIVEQGLPPDETARALVEADVRWFIYDSNNPFLAPEWPPVWLAESVLAPEFVAQYMQVAFEENGVIVYRIVPP